METVDIVVVQSSDLLRGDILCRRNEMHHFQESTANNVERIVLVARVILGCGETHKIHGDD
jgi:hypothetical protein